MPAAFANMDHGMAFVEKPAGYDPSDDQFMISGGMSPNHSAVEIGQSVLENGRTTVDSLNFHIRKGRLLAGKAAAKMDDHVRLGIIQNIHDKGRAFRQPIGDFSSFSEGHANLRGIKGALLDPARQHAGFGVSASGGDDEHAADDST